MMTTTSSSSSSPSPRDVCSGSRVYMYVDDESDAMENPSLYCDIATFHL
jgi:hypothetical protein